MKEKQQAEKSFGALQAYNMNSLVDKLNSNGITKEDVVAVLPNADNGYFLLYYK